MPQPLAPRGLVLLQHADVYAPQALGHRDVLVAGGTVVGLAERIEPPRGVACEILDLQGARLVPGLVDAHTHLCGGGGEAGAATRVPAVQLTHLSLAGVTTAIGLLGTDGTTRSIAELLAAARGLGDLGLTTFCYTGSYQVPPVTLTGSVRGDIVHVDRIVAVGEVAISDHRSSQPTFDEIARLAADAHVAGMMTGKAGLLHLHLGDGPRGLELLRRVLRETELPPRVFHPTHCNRNPQLWQEAKDFTRRGATIDVTAFPPAPDELGAGLAVADFLRDDGDIQRITVSSDGGGCLPVFDPDGNLLHMDVGRSTCLVDALTDLLELGVPLDQALLPFTRNVARLFRLSGKGELLPGADADLVVLDEGGRPRDVMALGRWLVRGGRPVVRGPFEAGPMP